MYNVYILSSLKLSRYYTGCTNNLEKRLLMHNQGRVFSTKPYHPWRMVYTEKFDTLSQARKRETQIKSWKKRKSIENLINKGPIV